MILLNIKIIKINYLNYFNKLILNKNILSNNKNIENIFIKNNHKKSTSKLVTLRAPKHFKVGRHHYSIITNKSCITLKIKKIGHRIPFILLYKYIAFLQQIVSTKKLPKAVSLLTNLTVTYTIKKEF